MFKKFKKQNLAAGFSLVEMLVAIGIFMSIMTISISSLLSIISANKKAQAIKSTIDSVTFAIESISRDMRMGVDYQCSPDGGTGFTTNQNICKLGTSVVSYTSNNDKSLMYKFSTTTINGKVVSKLVRKTLLESKKNNIVCSTNCETDLISEDSDVNIDNMVFYVMGADREFDSGLTKTQPRVIITASGFISVKGGGDTTFNLQTNISQRIRR